MVDDSPEVRDISGQTEGPTANLTESKTDENLWASVLSEVQTSRNSQLPTSKNLLVLGDKESGKTTLIAKLQANEDPKKGAGLEYGYIDVRDEYRDDHTRLGHWILDGDPSHSHLLRFALTEENFTDTTVLLCVAMTTPWNIMDQLKNWARILQDHIDKLSLSAETTKKLQNENIRRWQSYVEPGDEIETGSPTKRISRSNLDQNGGDFDSEDMTPLPEGTLNRNLGLDLIVVVTKTDYMADLERDYDYKEEHFDFIQQAVRHFCLQFGASLFYISVKEDKNCDLLYKYLVHRIYGFPFKTPALVVEKDAVFIPAGWDNEKKVAILYENMHSMRPDQYFTDVIAKPIVRKSTNNRDIEITAEDEQQFLLRQQQYLQQGNPTGAGAGASPAGALAGSPNLPQSIQKDPNRKSVGSPGVQSSPRKASEQLASVGPGGANTSEGVLANFFNSLLSKKTAQPGSPGNQIKPTTGLEDYNAKAVRSDAAAELDRLTRGAQKKPSGSGHNSMDNSLNNSSSEC